MTATVAELDMGRQRNNDLPAAGSPEERKYATFRCYVEQAEKLNELARICRRPDGKRTTIADVIELLDGAIDQLLVTHTEQRLRELTKRKK